MDSTWKTKPEINKYTREIMGRLGDVKVLGCEMSLYDRIVPSIIKTFTARGYKHLIPTAIMI